VDILVEGVPKFTGQMGIYKGSYALKIRKEYEDRTGTI